MWYNIPVVAHFANILSQNELTNGYTRSKFICKRYTTKIKLSGLTCSACQKIVEKKLKNINGISGTTVDLSSGNVEITAERVVDRSEIVKVLEGTGYKIIS